MPIMAKTAATVNRQIRLLRKETDFALAERHILLALLILEPKYGFKKLFSFVITFHALINSLLNPICNGF